MIKNTLISRKKSEKWGIIQLTWQKKQVCLVVGDIDSCGIDKCLRKPFHILDLVTAIERG